MGYFVKAKQEKAIWLQKAKNMEGLLNVSSEDVKLQVHIIELDESDLKLIHAFKDAIEPRVEDIVDSFYVTILQVPELKEIINKHSTVEKLRKTLISHMLSLFIGVIEGNIMDSKEMERAIQGLVGVIQEIGHSSQEVSGQAGILNITANEL
ncbi:hypothetical protein GW626_09755 [Peribacillus muralis]|uniref:protoglobin domain-containing protein n=1 Tax=Peribacillus muralis TaxID=264697 RepID=UPI001F4EBDA0|nr:protoglobin domain-containing protein [Peribacillus muralis]MCK1993651.1 protoglobin domain-containing protein [Peribacillus muralis]MCK2014061.1 protoglobin domain-containing protein [Peribacillus muralis]